MIVDNKVEDNNLTYHNHHKNNTNKNNNNSIIINNTNHNKTTNTDSLDPAVHKVNVVIVDHEVADQGRDGQADDQHSKDGRRGTHHLAWKESQHDIKAPITPH